MMGVRADMTITQKYLRGTFEGSITSAILAMRVIKSAIAENERLIMVAAKSFQSQSKRYKMACIINISLKLNDILSSFILTTYFSCELQDIL